MLRVLINSHALHFKRVSRKLIFTGGEAASCRAETASGLTNTFYINHEHSEHEMAVTQTVTTLNKKLEYKTKSREKIEFKKQKDFLRSWTNEKAAWVITDQSNDRKQQLEAFCWHELASLI